MYKKKKKAFLDIEESALKQLKLFEKIYGKYDTEMGHSFYYLRVPGGLIRTVVSPESINQIFISVPNTYFIC